MPVPPASGGASILRGSRRPKVRVGILCVAAWLLFAGIPAPSAQIVASSGVRPPADAGAAQADYESARSLLDARLFAPAAAAFASFRVDHPEHARAPEALFHEAEATLAAGDVEGAQILFMRFRDENPGHPLAGRAALSVGERAFAEGDDARAEAALREGLEGEDRLPEAEAARARYLLGLTLGRQGRTAEALSEFDRVAREYPATTAAPSALYAAGASRAVDADWQGAADAFSRLERDYPEAPETARIGPGLGEALARLGRFDEAAAALATRRPSLSGDAAARADLLLGDALLRLGRRDEARARLAAVPDSSGYGRRARFALARIDFDAGNWSEASSGFAAVRAGAGEGGGVDALAHEAGYLEGLSLKQMGDLAAAEQRLADVASSRPDGTWAAAALLEVGLLRFERRRYAEAAVAFEEVLDRYDTSPVAGEAARLLGEAYTALGDNERAREAVARAERLGEGAGDLREEVAFQDALDALETDPARAIDMFIAVGQSDPVGPRAGEALFWAGEAAFRAGEYARAEGLFSDFLTRFPDHRQALPARYALAWTHFRRRDWAASATAFERFLAAYRPSDAEAVPYLADALLRLGDSYYALRRFEEAEAAYARARTAAPAGQGADYALYQTAQARAEAGRADEALAALDQLLIDYPSSPLRADAIYSRGSVYLNAGDYDAAIVAFEQVVAEHPDSPVAARAYYSAGDAHFNAGRAAQAETAYRGVLMRYPESPFVANALEGLDAALTEQGRRDELGEIVADVESRITDRAARDRLRLRRAELDVAAGNFVDAEGTLAELAEGSSDADVPPRALFALGEALVGMELPGDAADAYGRLVSEYRGHALQAEAALRQGEALLADGQVERAAEVLSNYERDYPDDATLVAAALWAEARALRAAGRMDEADERVQRLVSEFPDTPAAAEARADTP